jgi:hypothetical protein
MLAPSPHLQPPPRRPRIRRAIWKGLRPVLWGAIAVVAVMVVITAIRIALGA